MKEFGWDMAVEDLSGFYPCNCMSTKKEKCGLCKHETPCPHSRLDNMMDKAFQSESIEWEKDLSFRFDTWLKLYPGTPTIGEIEEWWLESLRISITTAVAKAGKKAYAEGFEDGCKAH
jgi:hypothetical protein